MEREDLVTIQNVLAVSDGLALICEVEGARFGVPHPHIAASSEVQKVGDRGRLVIPRELAVDLGMPHPTPS